MRFSLALLLSIFAGSTAAASTQGSPEEIRFETAKSIVLAADHSRWEFGKPVPLFGTLSLPAGHGSFALVVLAHGCDGLGPVENGWANVLNTWGYATFLLDSFADRNLESICTDGKVLRPIQRVPDVYGALNALSKHPKIDPKRIALMGFSHGGALTLSASTVWAKKQFVPTGQPAFRAFVSFYPANCNVEYPERSAIYAPVRIHVGELDDWTPAAPCLRLVNGWKTARQDADITSYPGAYHAFDWPELAQTRLSDAENGAGCTLRFASVMGPFAPPVEGPGCVKKGATVAGNREATEKAERLVRSQLSQLLK